MKTIYSKTIIAAMALLSAASCQGLQDITTPDTPGDGAGKIEFKSVSVPMAAGQQSVVSAGLFAGDPINMYNVRLDINASGQVTPQTPVMWAPGQEKSTDFLAYSPYDETYSSRSKVTFAVKADQSTAEASAASDLLVAQTLSKPADGAVALNFEHKLSQISVYFKNRTGKDITKVTFASLVDCVVLDLENGYVTAGSSSSDIVAYNDAALGCYSVIVPAGTFALDLKITLSDGTVLSRTSKELSFAEGKSHDNANDPIVLEDSVVESINVNLSVSDWTYGGNVSFDEWEPPTMTINVSDITYNSAVMDLIPSDNNAYYINDYWPKSYFDKNFSSDEDYISYILSYYYDQYGNTYSNYGFSSYEELVLQGLAWQGAHRENPGLDADTEYIIVSFFIDEKVQAISELTRETFRTAVRPAGDKAYDALLGTYKLPVLNYTDNAPFEASVIIEEDKINETFLFSIPDLSPDTYPAVYNAESKSLNLANNTLGQNGYGWNFGENYGYCALKFNMFSANTGHQDFGGITISQNQDGSVLTLSSSPAVPAQDTLCFGSEVWMLDGTPIGYYRLFKVPGNTLTEVTPAKAVSERGLTPVRSKETGILPKRNMKGVKIHKAIR